MSTLFESLLIISLSVPFLLAVGSISLRYYITKYHVSDSVIYEFLDDLGWVGYFYDTESGANNFLGYDTRDDLAPHLQSGNWIVHIIARFFASIPIILGMSLPLAGSLKRIGTEDISRLYVAILITLILFVGLIRSWFFGYKLIALEQELMRESVP